MREGYMAESKESSVTDRLKALRERAGLSMDRLAHACGYKGASSYQRYENAAMYGKPWLPLPLVARLADALTGLGDPPIARDEVLALSGIREAGTGSATILAPELPGLTEVEFAKAAKLPGNNAFPRDMPVYGVAIGGTEGDFSFNGTVVDYVRRPPMLTKIGNAFGVYVIGDSMSPRFDHGDLVFVHPGRPPRPGNDVIVEMHGEHGAPGPCYIKRLVRRSADRVQLAQFNPPRDDIAIEASRIKAVYRILTAAEMMGV
jgi:phage repressor protein C with HTH and peptisase S24 domain